MKTGIKTALLSLALASLPVRGVDTLYYYHNDHLGTPQMMTNDSQEIVWQADYRPFGEVAIVVGDIENNLRFLGQYYDAESELHYNYFRDYDPTIGRYIQSDPIGLRGGINTYLYVRGNPLRYIDPFGLVDLNLFNSSEQIHSSAENVESPPGVYTVGGHGNSTYMIDQNGNILLPSQLAAMIKGDPNSVGKDIKLMSCHVGLTQSTGAPSFAQLLANELGVPVMGPANYVHYYNDDSGRTVVAPLNVPGDVNSGPDLSHPGSYTTFNPSGP